MSEGDERRAASASERAPGGVARTYVPWSERFQYTNLKKGEKAVYMPLLLSQKDKRLLDMAASAAGLKPGHLAARLLSQVLDQNRRHFEGNQ